MGPKDISIEVEVEKASTSYPEVSGLPSEYKKVLEEDGEMEALVKFKQKPGGKICIEEINGESVSYEKQVDAEGYMDDFFAEEEVG